MPTTHPNENTKIIILASSWKTRAFDKRAEEGARKLIREAVLLKRSEPYFQVRAKIKHAPDGTPERIIATLLRANTYTADVVEIRTNATYGALEVREGPELADDDDEEAAGSRGPTVAEFGDYDVVCATPVPEIETARQAVEYVAGLARSLGLRVQVLLGEQATVAAYKAALASGLRAFVNVGHGNTSGIALWDGTLGYAWFDGCAAREVSPAVVYFNSCQVFNAPLQPAVMKAGARTFIGGIVNLLIGPSEEVCKSFWRQSWQEDVAMGTALTNAERDNYPTQGAHGISGDLGPFGLVAARITIYEHASYGGRSRDLPVGSYDLAQIGLPNDSLSSLRVPAGLKVTLFQDAGFQGNSVTYTESSPSVGSFNDKTSSIVVQTAPTAPMVDVYEHADYRGMRKQLGVGRYNLAQMGLPNDCVSSLRVGRGLKVTLYQDAGFQGQSVSYLSDTSYVGSFNDKTSSIVVEPAAALQVELFEDEGFRGRCTVLGVGSYSAGEHGIGNDRLTSLRVPRGLEVTLYEHAGFQGASVRYTQSTSNVGSFNDRTSSIRVRRVLVRPTVLPEPPVVRFDPTNGPPRVPADVPVHIG